MEWSDYQREVLRRTLAQSGWITPWLCAATVAACGLYGLYRWWEARRCGRATT